MLRFALVLSVAVALAFAVGWLLHDKFAGPSVEVTAVRLESQVRRIAQFATAEGVYTDRVRKRFPGSTATFQFTDKKLEADGRLRVLYGFDLDSVRVRVDHEARTVSVAGWPPPRRLSSEFAVEFTNVYEAWFGRLTERDINGFRDDVRESLEEFVDEPVLRRRSYEAAGELLGLIAEDLVAAGWRLEVAGWPAEVPLMPAAPTAAQ